MNTLKHEERGLDAVCEVMEKYEQKAVTKANVEAIKFMVTTLNASKEQILQQYSECEYNEALNELPKNKKVWGCLKGSSQTEMVLFLCQSHRNKNFTRVSAIALLR